MELQLTNKKPLFVSLLLILIFLLTASCSGSDTSVPDDQTEMASGTTAETPTSVDAQTGEPWWKEAVFYEIFVRSFLDSDGDGDGDFTGLTDRLDYLSSTDPQSTDSLGVGGIWLMPIFPSPSYHGYDVIDYYSVNPDFGTMEEFQRLLDQAHQLGIRVIIDLPLNHTSTEHPWFIDSQNPDSPYRDWYVWSDTDPGTIGPWGQQVWHSGSSGYYYGVFWGGMPDLNYKNPEVVEEMEKVIRFWLEEVGVDGFRLDGARYVIEEGETLADSETNLQYFQDLRAYVRDINPQALLLGEVWTSGFVTAGYIKQEALDLVFEFDLASAYISSAGAGRAESALNQLLFSLKLFTDNRFAPFLTNHDMNRVVSQLGGDINKAKNAAAMLLTAPGVPFVYYGEEIGMVGVKPDEDIRTPMQWSAEKHAGFTTGIPWRAVNGDYPEVNVRSQSQDMESLLVLYQSLIEARNNHSALLKGDTYIVESEAGQVYSILRSDVDSYVLVVVNLGAEPLQEYRLSLTEGPLSGTYTVQSLLTGDLFAELAASESGGFDSYLPLPSLPANARLVLDLQ
jgi:glycosidase